jgi:hypothetical protein
MLKAKTVISSAVILALLSPLSSFAASPQENNAAVQKAMEKLQQGLQMQSGNNGHIQIVVAKGQQNSNSTIQKPKLVNAVHYKPHIVDSSAPQAVISAISVSPNAILVSHDGGSIIYHIRRQTPKIFVLDIVNPVYTIGTQNYRPDQTGSILNVITTYHTNRRLYGYPYLRITIYLKNAVPYSVGSINNDFAVGFGDNIKTLEPIASGTVNSATANNPNTNNPNQTPNAAPLQIELMQKINDLQQQILQMQTKMAQSTQVTALPEKTNQSSLSSKYGKQNKPQQPQQMQFAKTIKISAANISCIKSPYSVNKVIYSKEDNIQIQVVGKDVFVKILPRKIQNPDGTYKYVYSHTPRDIYIVTDAKTYSINLVPNDIPSVTYSLEPQNESPQATQQQILQQQLEQKQIEYAQNNSPSFNQGQNQVNDNNGYVNSLLEYVKESYMGKAPDGFVLMPFNFSKNYEQFELTGEYKFVGQNAVVYVYKLKAHYSLNLDPSQFVWLGPHPMAAAVVDPRPKANETTQVIIVGGK